MNDMESIISMADDENAGSDNLARTFRRKIYRTGCKRNCEHPYELSECVGLNASFPRRRTSKNGRNRNGECLRDTAYDFSIPKSFGTAFRNVPRDMREVDGGRLQPLLRFRDGV